MAGFKNGTGDSKEQPESQHRDDIMNSKNDMWLKMDEGLWRTTGSSKADYLPVSCDLKLAFSRLMTHGQKVVTLPVWNPAKILQYSRGV